MLGLFSQHENYDDGYKCRCCWSNVSEIVFKVMLRSKGAVSILLDLAVMRLLLIFKSSETNGFRNKINAQNMRRKLMTQVERVDPGAQVAFDRKRRYLIALEITSIQSIYHHC